MVIFILTSYPARLRKAILAVVTFYFLWSAGAGLKAYFTADDMMNLYTAWVQPWSELLLGSVLIYTPSSRTLGAIFYRLIYAAAGFDPLPYRVVVFALLVVNLWLLFRLIRALTGSDETAAVSTVIAAYHPREADLYCSTGTVYDVLCFLFYIGALAVYVGARQRGRTVSGVRLASFLALYVCALQSKEMAATLPIMVIAYEAMYHRAAPLQWIRQHWVVLGFLLGITGAWLWGNVIATGPLTNHPPYTPTITAGQFFGTWGASLAELFYTTRAFSPLAVCATLTALAVCAWLLRSPHLGFGWVFIVGSMLPIAFIPPRAGYALYIPMVGWSMYLACLLTTGADFLFGHLRVTRGGRGRRLAGVGLLLVTTFLLVRAHRVQRSWTIPCRAGDQQKLHALDECLKNARVRLLPGARILFIDDPFPMGDYVLEFFVRLRYADRSLVVDRVRGVPVAKANPGYALALHYNRPQAVFWIE